MARIRTIKPDFFRHEGLFEAERETGLPLRIAYAGLWTACDREGRFRWRPRQLKLDCLPYDDVDFELVLDALAASRFIIKYEKDNQFFGFVPSWREHQVINQREAQSTLPEPAEASACTVTHVHAHAYTGQNTASALRDTIIARDGAKCCRCPATDDLTIDHIFPRSMGGTHALSNLRIMCRSCNSARPVSGLALIEDLAKDDLTLEDMQRMCMHQPEQVHAHGEGKGKEGERKGKERKITSCAASGAKEASGLAKEENPSQIAERELYALGKKLCGRNAGGLISSLVRHCNYDLTAARSIVDAASTKQDPREYIAASMRSRQNGHSVIGAIDRLEQALASADDHQAGPDDFLGLPNRRLCGP